MKRLTILTLTAFGLIIFHAGLYAQDIIELKDGKKLTRVRIQTEGLLKVEYKKPGLPTQYIDSLRVRNIRYQGTGNEFKTAKEAFNDGRFVEAAELFLQAGDKSGSRPPFQAHCYYRSAECYQKAGDWTAAFRGFTDFANTFNAHRLYPTALENRGICLLNNRETAKAKKEFNLFKKKVQEKGLPDYWKYEAEYWVTYMLERENPNRALKDYAKIYEDTRDTYPSVANKARLRIGRVYMEEKKFQQSLDLFNEIIANRDPDDDSEREIVAWAYLSRGTCIMRMPKKGEGTDDFKRALFDVLRVVIRYQDVGGPQAEALYWAGKCFQHLGGKESTKRWQTLYLRLQREWPGTQWAQEATKELGG